MLMLPDLGNRRNWREGGRGKPFEQLILILLGEKVENLRELLEEECPILSALEYRCSYVLTVC